MIKSSQISRIRYPSGEISSKKDSVVNEIEKSGIFMIDDPSPDSIFLSLSAINELNNPVKVIIAYLPDARADKPGNFDIETMSKIIATGKFSEVFVLDPHSETSKSIFEREMKKSGISVKFIYPVDIVSSSVVGIENRNYDAVIAPDSGARERASMVANYLNVPLITCKKKRDQETGKILYHNINDEFPDFAKNVIVVDDICDGGYTFKLLRDSIPDYVTSDLYVSHGIFSGRANENLSGYREIFTTDSLSRSPSFDYKATKVVELSEPLWINN